MATFTGKSGVIKIDTDTLAEAKSWTLETTADPVEHSVIGDDWRKYMASMQGYTVTLEGYYDIADVAQQALAIGDPVVFTLFPAGETSGEKEYGGSAYVTAFSETASFDGMVEFSASLQGTGALVETTVTP